MDPSEPLFRTGQPTSGGCEFRSSLGAYHDGELSASAFKQVEQHLATCGACQAELEDIREMSALAATIGAEGISPFGMRRIHQAIDADPRFSALKFAGILTGLAASILVVGSAWLFEMPSSPRESTPTRLVIERHGVKSEDWMAVASTLEARPLPRAAWERRDQQMLADARFSNWMVENLTGRYP